jgi:hypothetical protein
VAAAQQKTPVPAVVSVFLEGPTEVFEVADTKDWAVIFDDVLEVKAKDGTTHYFPLPCVKKWTVR